MSKTRRSRAEEFIASLPVDDEGRKILTEGGGSRMEMTLDPSRALVYNKEEILIRQDGFRNVNAVLHGPLRAAQPLAFGFIGVS